MDIDRKKQRVADAMGMTHAEVEAMGKIEWVPQVIGLLRTLPSSYQADDHWHARLLAQPADYEPAEFVRLESRPPRRLRPRKPESSAIPENGQSAENNSNTSTK